MTKRYFLCISAFLNAVSFFCQAQEFDGFTDGNVSVAELKMQRYDKDTSANAVVLNEFGSTYINNEPDNNLIHEYHVRIKIFNEKGFGKATFVIPIRKSSSNGNKEEVSSIKGSTFNLVNGQIEESRLTGKRIYTENKTRYFDQVKFTLPNVKAGSVVEVSYTLSSPYLYNFRNWDFQSDVPKIHSEYWARIPANLIYNVTLRGYYKLTKNEASRVRDCLVSFNGGKADCSLLKFGMDSIPAFVEEDFMTAKSNFLSAIYFELSEVHYFDGRVEKVTKEWSDVDQQLKDDDKFGRQLKRSKDLFDVQLDTLLKGSQSDEEKAGRIFSFVKHWYKWDGYNGMFAENGLKKAFENHTGNVADINLSLIAALRRAGLNADPLVLSTRENGLPNSLHPVISDFNWVVARLQTSKAAYLLDATDPYLPFGVIQESCLNGQGRLFPQDAPSKWIDILPAAHITRMAFINLSLDSSGKKLSGEIVLQYQGYQAIDKRKELASYGTQDEYVEKMSGRMPGVHILGYQVSHLHDDEEPLSEKFKIEMDHPGAEGSPKLLIHPFLIPVIQQNPFKSSERNYPVDFGSPEEIQTIFALQFPGNWQVETTPSNVALSLPNEGGSFLMGGEQLNNHLVVRSILTQKKSVYNADEYFVLKELYNRIIQAQGSDIILSRKQ